MPTSGGIARGAEFEIAPQPAFIDEEVLIRMRGLLPLSRIDLRATVRDDAWRLWESHGQYLAGADGSLDVAAQDSLGGTYSGRDAMGLFWSMQLEAGRDDERGTFRKDGASTDVVTLSAEMDGRAIAAGKFERRWLAEDVEIRSVTSEGLVARLFIPPGRRPRRAVLVLGGSGGGYDVDKAAVLARHGFAALALAYFGMPGLPPWLHRVRLEYFERAIAWLGRQPEVDARRLGVLGVSRGAEVAMLLGSRFAQIAAVAAFAPSAVAWGSGGRDKSTGEIIPCWTWQGEALPFAPLPLRGFMMRSAVPVAMLRRPVKFRNLFRTALRNRSAIECAMIPVERTRGPILLISGGDDHVWPAARMAEMIRERLRAGNFQYPVEHLHYPQAGHEIRYPFLPATTRTTRPPGMKFRVSFGGTAKANAAAEKDAWRRTVAFLDSSLG